MRLKKYQSYVLLVIFYIGINSVYAQNEIQVVTYNIKYDAKNDVENNWDVRRDWVINEMKAMNPDVMGVQEALHNQMSDIKKGLSGFTYVGVGRDDGVVAGEYSAIFYDSTKFKKLKSGTFWLSETPDKVSKGWDAALPRISTFLEIENSEGDSIVIYNAHFDHIGEEARRESIKVVAKHIEENFPEKAIVFMGDLNFTDDDEAYKTALESGFEDASNMVKPMGPKATFNGFDFSVTPSNRIDYIFVKGELDVDLFKVRNTDIDGRYPSDHFPVMATISFDSSEKYKQTTISFTDELAFDVYSDPDLSGTAMPTILYVHGGGFSGGNRGGAGTTKFGVDMAKQGYVVVSTSYRLTMKGIGFGCDVPASDKLEAFANAGRDVARAASYLIENAESLNIDPDKIVLAGSSAGAEAVVHLAYWKEARMFDGKDLLPEDFNFAGVISMAGALYDDKLITSENAIPILMFHGTCDNLVPYDHSPHHYCEEGSPGYLMLHGGESISKRYQALNASYSLVTVCGGDHGYAGIPMHEYQSEMIDFINNEVVKGIHRQQNIWVSTNNSCEYYVPELCK